MNIWIGYEPRETNAYLVACASIRKYWPDAPIRPLILESLRAMGFYRRVTEWRDGVMYDTISEAPMSTEFAISRFLVPTLNGPGPALFMDCDMLIRSDLRELFELADPDRAVMCVQHDHKPVNTEKMDGQVQTMYQRKNWSSVMLFPDCAHPALARLTQNYVNSVTGRELHGFWWLPMARIGALGPQWNYLVGHTIIEGSPRIVHFTDGIPSMHGYENCEYADEWRTVLRDCIEDSCRSMEMVLG